MGISFHLATAEQATTLALRPPTLAVTLNSGSRAGVQEAWWFTLRRPHSASAGAAGRGSERQPRPPR